MASANVSVSVWLAVSTMVFISADKNTPCSLSNLSFKSVLLSCDSCGTVGTSGLLSQEVGRSGLWAERIAINIKNNNSSILIVTFNCCQTLVATWKQFSFSSGGDVLS